MSTFACPICGVNDWENIDALRLTKQGMCLCKECGFVTYPEKDKAKLLEYYRKEYRRPPTAQNIYSGILKNNIHAAFLAPLFETWKKDGIDKPVVVDIGAAFGMYLDFVRSRFPEGDFNGTELTLSYRRNAFHMFGLTLTEEMDETKKYNLISSYKVLEHQLEPDKELERYRRCLADNGRLYVSVPTWFGKMQNFGQDGFDLEYYYSPNHVNAWTQRNFEHLLAKSGFAIVQEEHDAYNEAYLCVKAGDDSGLSIPEREDPARVREMAHRVKAAWDAFQAKDFGKALELWPNYPLAWLAKYETNRARYHQEGGYDTVTQEIITPCLEACERGIEALGLVGDIMCRYSDFQGAIAVYDELLHKRHLDGRALMGLAQAYRGLSQAAETEPARVAALTKARDITDLARKTNMSMFADGMNWIMQDNAKLPMPAE